MSREGRRERDRDPNRISLLIRNLPLDCRADDVRYKFEKYGEIRDVYLPKDYYTGRPRGFGFLEYRDPRDAEEALYHLDRTVFMGREISVVMSKESRKTPRDMIQRERTSAPARGSDRRDRRDRSRSPRRERSRSRSPQDRRGGRGRSYSRSRSPPRRRSRSRSRTPPRADSPPPRRYDDDVPPRSPAEPARHSGSPDGSPRGRSRSPRREGSPRDDDGYENGAASPPPSGGNAADSPRRGSADDY